MLTVRQATIEDIEHLVPLFTSYRQFYRQPSDPARAKDFLTERLRQNESAVFLAFEDAEAIGFTQLYPSFSSGALARIYILNDLFVAPQARRSGAASALLNAAADFARGKNAARLTLSTEVTNETAQALYRKSGWKQDTAFLTYQLSLL